MLRLASLAAVSASTLLLVCAALGCGGSEPSCAKSTCGSGGSDGGGAGGSGGAAPTTFTCKGVTCMHDQEECLVTTHFHQNATGACMPLPSACIRSSNNPHPDCSCLGDLGTCTCMQTADGDLNVFCDMAT